MLLRDIYKDKKRVISFEIFPPKESGDLPALYETVAELKKFSPSFVSVTYGAGGGTKDKTVEIASFVKNNIGIESVAHFTCVNSTKEEIKNVINIMHEKKIENILALRGDPPLGQTRFTATLGGFEYANELVDFIKSMNNWSVAVAGYPEGHPDSKSLEEDMISLKRKVDAGADVIITQLFFNNEYFYRFRDSALKCGINVPIIPGIFPITNFKSIKKISSISKAEIPANLYKKLEEYQDSPLETEKIGIEHAILQSNDLLRNSAVGLHFYTMNKSDHIEKIFNELR